MAGRFWLFVSGRSARLRRDQESDANDQRTDEPMEEPFVRNYDNE
jgi:hypothetical protein